MATIASSVQWGSSPKIYFDFSYEKKREGSTQYYQIKISCHPLTGTHYFGYPIYVELKVAGGTAATATFKAASPSRWTNAITYTSGWIPVANKTTGTTPISIRLYSGMGSTRDKTYNYNLEVDPAACKISATDANIESTSTISITKYDTNFTTSVSYKVAGQDGYEPIWTKQAYSSYGWEVPNSLYNHIPDAKEIELTLRCLTYSGNTLLGEETCTMTATTNPAKCCPVLSFTAVDVNNESIALTGNNKTNISGISNLRVVTEARAKNDAIIVSIVAQCGGTSKDGADVTFEGADSADVYVTVTDSRGYSTLLFAKDLSLVGYITPTIIPTITRDTPTGDTVSVSVKGRWYNGSFGAAQNAMGLRISRKKTSEPNYHTEVVVPVTANGNEYTGTITLTDIDYTSAYSFELRLEDAVYADNGYRNALYATVPLAKGIPIFDWGEDDFAFNVPVKIDGDLTIGKTTITEAQLVSLLALLK